MVYLALVARPVVLMHRLDASCLRAGSPRPRAGGEQLQKAYHGTPTHDATRTSVVNSDKRFHVQGGPEQAPPPADANEWLVKLLDDTVQQSDNLSAVMTEPYVNAQEVQSSSCTMSHDSSEFAGMPPASNGTHSPPCKDNAPLIMIFCGHRAGALRVCTDRLAAHTPGGALVSCGRAVVSCSSPPEPE